MFTKKTAEALTLKKLLFGNAEIMEEDADDTDDDIDLDDDDGWDDDKGDGDKGKKPEITEPDEKDKLIAKLTKQNERLWIRARNAIKEKKALEANGYLDDEKTERILDQRARLKEYKEEYPDLDVEAVKKLARDKNLSIDEAVRIIKFDDVKKNAPKIWLWGRTAVSTEKTQYTRADLKAANQAEYNKISDLIKSGKATLVD